MDFYIKNVASNQPGRSENKLWFLLRRGITFFAFSSVIFLRNQTNYGKRKRQQ